MSYTPPDWDAVDFAGTGEDYTPPDWNAVHFNQGYVYTTTDGASAGDSDASATSLTYRTAHTNMAGVATAASISYSVGVGSSQGVATTNFRNAVSYGAGQSSGVGFLSAIVTLLQCSGYSRAWSAATGINPSRVGRGSATGTSSARSVNPYLYGRGSSMGTGHLQSISYAKGTGKSRGKSWARTLPAPKPPGWTRSLYGSAFGVIVGSAGHSSGAGSASGAS